MTELVLTATSAAVSAAGAPPWLRVRQLGVAFGRHVVLDGVDLDFAAGQVTALVGPSGAGKTTILAAISRLVDLTAGARTSGRVAVGELDVLAPTTDVVALRRRVGQLFQRPTPFPMSVRRNLELPLREHVTRDRARLAAETERLLRSVGLWAEVAGRLDAPATTLSGGQQQRLCLARALATGPDVLLLDEPCSALDPSATAQLEGLVRSLRGRLTIVVVTHNLAQARRLADHVALLWPGAHGAQVVAQDRTARFFASAHPVVRRFLAAEAIALAPDDDHHGR